MEIAPTTRVAADLNDLAEAKGWPMRCDAKLEFERRDLHALCDIWRSKASGGVPQRSVLDMRTLKPFARNLAILERTQCPARYRFRLFGSTLALLFGEHTGRFLDEMVSAQLLPGWTAFYDGALAGGAVLRFINYYRIPTQAYLKGEILAAPLADESGEVRMILASTYVGLKDGAPPPFG